MKSRGDYDLTIRPNGEPKFTEMFPLRVLRLLGVPFDAFPRDTGLSDFEWFLILHTQLLNTSHLIPFVDGDFSQWLNILESYVDNFKADYFREFNKELPIYKFKELEEYIYIKRMQNHYP
ncbi:MAG: hypothetical protein U0V02_01895 [Anaerolineales bacterium]